MPLVFDGIVKKNKLNFDFDDEEFDSIAGYIRKHEGKDENVYKDTGGKPTIGIGHLIKKGEDLSNFDPEEQFKKDVTKEGIKKAKRLFPAFDEYPLEVKKALADGAFRGDFETDHKTVRYINTGQWEKVPTEYINRDDYRESKASEKYPIGDERRKTGIYKRLDENASLLKTMQNTPSAIKPESLQSEDSPVSRPNVSRPNTPSQNQNTGDLGGIPEKTGEFAGRWLPSVGKGAFKAALSSPQAFGSLIMEMGERAEETPRWYDYLSPTQEGIIKSIKSRIMKRTDADERLAELGKSIIQDNKDVITYLYPDLAKAPGSKAEQFAENLGSGITTLAGALGLSLLTKSPTTAAVAFGLYQKGNIYQEAREKGIGPEKAGRLSTIAGAVEGSLEYIGLDFMLSKFSASPLLNIAVRAGSEAFQEFSQQVGENLVTKIGGIREVNNIFEGAGQAALIGLLLGAPAGVSVEIAERQGIIKQLKEKGIPDPEKLVGAIIATQKMELQPKVNETIGEMNGEKTKSMMKKGQLLQPFGEGQKKPTPKKEIQKEEIKKATEPLKIDLAGEQERLSEFDRLHNLFYRRIKKYEGFLDEELSAIPKEYITTKEGIKVDEALAEAREAGFNFESIYDLADALKEAQSQKAGIKQNISDIKNEISLEANKAKRKAQRLAITEKFKVKEANHQQVKQAIVNYARQNLMLPDRGKLLAAVKNAKTIKNLQDIEQRIDRLQEQTDRRVYKKIITKILNKTKVRKQSGKPVGKYTPQIQKVLDTMRLANRISVEESKARYARFNSIDPTEISPLAKFENMIYAAKSGALNSARLKGLYSMIKEIRDTGRSQAIEKAAQWEESRQGWINKAIDTITGGKGISESKTAQVKDFGEGGLKGKIAQFGKSQVGWQDLMDILSYNTKDAPGESFFNIFGDVFEAGINEIEGNRIAFEKIRDMGKKAFGYESDRKFADRLMKDIKDTFIYRFKNANGEDTTVEMNRSQVRKRYMELLAPDLTDFFMDKEGMAYTPDLIQAFDNYLTEQDKAFIKGQLEFYRSYYDRVNPVYREIYAVDLPLNEYYSPIAREGFAGPETFTALLDEIAHRTSIAPGSLKSRVKNTLRIKDQSDTTVLQKHIVDMEHFINWVGKLRELKAVFGNPQVKKAIKAYYGDGMNIKISGFLEDFTRNGMSRASRVEGLDRFRANFARSVLAIKPSIGAKQLTSFLAYMEAMPVTDFTAGQIDFWLNPIANTKRLLGSEYMRDRGNSVTRDLRLAMQTDEFQNFRGSPNFWNSLMLNVQFGDKGAIIVGGHSLYRYLRKQGKSHEEAIREFEKFTDRTQQSGRIEQLNSIQRGGSWAKLFTMFKSAPNQYVRKELTAVKNILLGKGSKTQALKTIAIYHFLLPGLFQYVANAFRWDDDDQLRAAILGPFNGLPLIGDGLEAIVRSALGQRIFDLANPISGVAKEAARAVDALSDMTKEGINNEDMKRAIEGLAATLGAPTGIPIESGISLLEGLFETGAGDTEKGLKKLLGWSQYTIERAGESKPKSGSRKGSRNLRF